MDHLNLVACLYRPLENDIFCIHSSHSVPSEVLRNFCDDMGCWFWDGKRLGYTQGILPSSGPVFENGKVPMSGLLVLHNHWQQCVVPI